MQKTRHGFSELYNTAYTGYPATAVVFCGGSALNWLLKRYERQLPACQG